VTTKRPGDHHATYQPDIHCLSWSCGGCTTREHPSFLFLFLTTMVFGQTLKVCRPPFQNPVAIAPTRLSRSQAVVSFSRGSDPLSDKKSTLTVWRALLGGTHCVEPTCPTGWNECSRRLASRVLNIKGYGYGGEDKAKAAAKPKAGPGMNAILIRSLLCPRLTSKRSDQEPY